MIVGRIIPILILSIVVIFVSGCTGAQVFGPTPTPTPAPTPIPSPMVFFSYNPSSGYAPLQVAFMDQSTNNPTAWVWSFGDGATSTLQNPTHIYISPGTYTVSLTAVNAGGSKIDSKTILVSAVPTAQVIYVTPAPTPVPTAVPTQTQTPKVTITAVNWHISYTSTTGYFGPDSQSFNGWTANLGSSSVYSMTFKSSALIYSHTIDSISIQTPGFMLVSVAPSLPSVSISPDSSITESLTIQVPNTAYTGPLDIWVSTS